MKLQIILLLLLFLGVGFLLTPVYQTTDDTEAQLTLSGISACAQPTAGLRYSHVWLGELLAASYRVAPNAPCYGLFLYALHFLGMLGIVYYLKKNASSPKVAFTWLTWALAFELIFLQQLQFTTTAFIAALGALCAADALKGKALLAPLSLFLLAAMLRWESAVLVLATTLPIALLLAENRQKRIRLLLLGISLAALSVGVWQSHILLQSRHEGWRAYYAREATGVRIGMLDYRDQRYAWTPETAPIFAAAAHWSENDHRLFNRWFLADSSVFGERAMRGIQRAFAATEGMPLRERLGRAYYFFSHLPQHLTANILLIFMSLPFIPTWRQRGILLASLAWVCFLAFVLAGWRHLPERVSYPIFSVPLLLTWRLFTEQDKYQSYMKSIFSGVWALSVTLSFMYVKNNGTEAAKAYNDMRGFLERLDPPDGTLYFGNPGALWQRLALPFSPPQNTLLRRFHAADAGHLSDTPIYYRQLADLGITDLHRQVARGQVLLICYPNDSLLKYYRIFLKEHYGMDIEWECRFGEQGIAVYQAVLN